MGGAARVEDEYDSYDDESDDYQPRRRPAAKKKKKRKKKSQGLPGWVVPVAFVFVGFVSVAGIAIAVWPNVEEAFKEEPPEPTRTVELDGFLVDVPVSADQSLYESLSPENITNPDTYNGRTTRSIMFSLGKDNPTSFKIYRFYPEIGPGKNARGEWLAQFNAKTSLEAINVLHSSAVRGTQLYNKQARVSPVEIINLNGLEVGTFKVTHPEVYKEFFIHRPSPTLEVVVECVVDTSDAKNLEAAKKVLRSLRPKPNESTRSNGAE